MCEVTDCTSVETSSFEEFETIGNELEQFFDSTMTANKTDLFRAQIEVSLINRIVLVDRNKHLNSVIYSAKMELVGSPKAWQHLTETAEEFEETDEIDCREIVPGETLSQALDCIQNVTAQVALVSEDKIRTFGKLQARSYDANNHLLGSKTWTTPILSRKPKSN